MVGGGSALPRAGDTGTTGNVGGVGGASGAAHGDGDAADGSGASDCVVHVSVPKALFKGVFGRRLGKLVDIDVRYGVTTVPLPVADDGVTVPVQVTGTDAASVDAARRELEGEVRRVAAQAGGGVVEQEVAGAAAGEDVTYVTIEVPSLLRKRVLGERGGYVESLARETGAVIKVPQPVAGEEVFYVAVVGTRVAVVAAEDAIRLVRRHTLAGCKCSFVHWACACSCDIRLVVGV